MEDSYDFLEQKLSELDNHRKRTVKNIEQVSIHLEELERECFNLSTNSPFHTNIDKMQELRELKRSLLDTLDSLDHVKSQVLARNKTQIVEIDYDRGCLILANGQTWIVTPEYRHFTETWLPGREVCPECWIDTMGAKQDSLFDLESGVNVPTYAGI